MADLLTASQFAQLSGDHVKAYPVRTAKHVYNGSSTVETDISDYLKSVGNVKYVLSNRHPKRSQSTKIPILQIRLDNRDDLFTFGNADGLLPDEATRTLSTIQVVVKIMRPQLTVLDFTGFVNHPVHEDNGIALVTLEHATRELSTRVWQRGDQISYIDSNLISGKIAHRP